MAMGFEGLLELCGAGGARASCDSRAVEKGGIFVAIRGEKANGAEYALAAANAGASHIVGFPEDGRALEGRLPAGCSFIAHPDPEEALWRLAVAQSHTESLPLNIIGITGTNGKTTTAYLLESLLASLGHSVGVLGTVSYRWPGHAESASLTTPDAVRLNDMLAEMAAAGAGWAVMEVSSHALARRRVGGVPFTGAIFTNLTQDHLDFHHDLESYFRAKAKLFLELPKKDKPVAINADDPAGRRLLWLLPEALSYGLGPGLAERRHLRGEIISSSIKGLRLKMSLGEVSWELSSPLVGRFNALNLLACQAMALELGFQPADFAALEGFSGVRGRLERVPNERGLNVFVDYAHTPDALTNVLRALAGAGFRRIITVFGCGGDRDRAKRPLMGKAVAEGSDVAILTSDNPRTEDPLAILEDVRPGLAGAAEVVVEPDRAKATAIGISMLGPEDALLIAGKGHEDYQIIGSRKIHYSDQEMAAELMRCG